MCLSQTLQLYRLGQVSDPKSVDLFYPLEYLVAYLFSRLEVRE